MILEMQLREERERLTAEKIKLAEELDSLKANGVTYEEISRLKAKEKQLEDEISQFKQMVERGNVTDSTTGTDVLMMRIKSYEIKIGALEKRLKGEGKLTE
jgi:ABC-type phosphate transport system auxiliary subunit